MLDLSDSQKSQVIQDPNILTYYAAVDNEPIGLLFLDNGSRFRLILLATSTILLALSKYTPRCLYTFPFSTGLDVTALPPHFFESLIPIF